MKRPSIHILLPLAISAIVMSCAYSPDVPQDGYGEENDLAFNSSRDTFEEFSDNPFICTGEDTVSTFSTDADGASYAYMRAAITRGYKVNKSSVRIEEYLNYFTFDYPEPTDGSSVSIHAETGICPWNKNHYLVQLEIKGKAVAEQDMPDCNFVFLVDVSGSMSGSDRLDLLKKGLRELVSHMRPTDRVSIITYSGRVERVLESTLIKDFTEKTYNAIDDLYAFGSTNGGDAIKMAYEEAANNFIEGGNNRIILGTDGDFNVGVTSTEQLLEIVSEYADKGIYLTACGFGMGNWNDAMMEKISNRGNGTYVYVDNEDEMMKVFVNERSHFYSIANDAKCQVMFNPLQVDSFRLIGYENRVLSQEDFDDDKKDAGEIGAGQTITALYEIVPKASNNTEFIGHFDFRYKESLSSESQFITCPIENAEHQEKISSNMSFAAGVTAFGMILRESPYAGDASVSMAIGLVEQAMDFDPYGYRAELITLMRKYNEGD